ncbi:hypothetical protein P67b_00031 [Ruegeria phage Tedan]|nr:hypothetical protein P67b_00031 [Ruegeria phage Tedan]
MTVNTRFTKEEWQEMVEHRTLLAQHVLLLWAWRRFLVKTGLPRFLIGILIRLNRYLR